MTHEDFVAIGEGAGHLPVEDEKIGHEPGFHAFAVDPMIGGQGGHLAQDGSPLKIVERTSDALGCRQKELVFTSRIRAVLSARSTAPPRRVNQKESLRSMVR